MASTSTNTTILKQYPNSSMVRMRGLTAQKLSKKFEKPLDKLHKVWYNKDVPKRNRKDRRRKTPQTRKENPMKTEIRVAANSAVVSALREALGEKIVPVRVAKKDGYAFDTGVKDENGKPIYAVIEATVKNTEDTKTSKAFDLEEAVQARIDAENAPKKEAKPKKEADPEAEAKRTKREAQKQALHDWLTDNLTEEGMTTTDIQGACAEIADVSVMQIGTWMTAIAKEDPSIKRDVVKGKPYYSKA